MAREIIHTTGKLNDSQIVKLMKALADSFEDSEVTYNYGELELTEDQANSHFSRSKGYIISQCYMHTPGNEFRVWFKRGVSARNQQGQYDHNQRAPSPYYDEVIVLPGMKQAAPSPEQIKGLEGLISAHIIERQPRGDEKGAETAVDVLEAELARVASIHTQMLEDAAKLRHQTEQDRIAQLKEVSDAAKKLQDEHQAHVDAETERLEKLEQKVEEDRKSLDDRKHMHARRALREHINSDLQHRMRDSLIPPALKLESSAIILLSLIGVFFSCYIAVQSFEGFQGVLTAAAAEKAGITSVGYLMGAEFIRGVLASLGAVGLLLYTISWMRRTYLDQVKQRQELQKYLLDTNRASWAIETILEVTEVEGRQLPDPWVEGVCHGLFQTSEQENAEITPMEAWTALLSGSAKVQHGPDGTMLEMSGKDAKKMAKKQEAK